MVLATYKDQKRILREAAKEFLLREKMDSEVVDYLEAYIAGNEGTLCAVSKVPSKGLLNDLATQPYPVIQCDMESMSFSFTDDGKRFFAKI